MTPSTIPGLGFAKFLLRRKATGTADLRPILDYFETRFGDAIALGGLDAQQFGDSERAMAQALRNVRELVQDNKLGHECDAVLKCWNLVFAAARPRQMFAARGDVTVCVPDSETDGQHVERQVDAARQGQAAVRTARARATKLDGRIAGMS